jgi:hypothetical protein
MKSTTTKTRRAPAERVKALGAQWVVGRSGRRRVVIPYECTCGCWHEAVAYGWAARISRVAPCHKAVELVLGKERRR